MIEHDSPQSPRPEADADASPSASPPRLDIGHHGYSQDDLPELDHGPLNLQSYFGFPASPTSAARPLELEIGSGKGTFLVQQASLQPNTDFLGIEYAKPFWRHAADRCRRRKLENVRLLWADATVFARNYIPNMGLHRIHLYFPDPWPKKRHNKRRSFQAPFLRELHRLLEPAGEIHVATDHLDYFAWMEDHAAQVADLYERLAFVPPASAGEGELVGTNFERKYRVEGRTFNAMVLRKRPTA
ncbi:MAG: tRNA (guanosine(46)-N7)-methyltransferase TrmB [Algisphaera sp.]